MVVAELPSTPRGIPIKDIPAVFASLPRLTPAEAEAFGRDIDAARPPAREEDFRDPWGSEPDPAGDGEMTQPHNAVDEVLDKLHELRLAIDACFEHDVDKYVAYLREFEEQLLREGWVEAPPRPKQDRSAA